MTSWISWTLSHRRLVLVLVGLVTAISLASISRAVIATSAGTLFFGDSPDYRAYQARVRQFANDEFFVVAYADPAPLSTASLDRLARVVARIQRCEGVGRVHSLLEAPRVGLISGLPVVERYAEAARRDPTQADALYAALRKDPLAGDLLTSRDGTHVAVYVELTVAPDRPVERAPQLVREVADQFRQEGYEKVHLAGLPALFGEIIDQTYINLLRLLPLAILTLLIVVFAIFRRLAPVVVSMGVAAISVIWCMGLATAIDRNLNIMLSVVPAVVLVISFSDVIHLWSAYLIELREGRARDDAILASASEVGVACLLTSATTFVGFVCLSLVPTPVFRQLGVILGFGVSVALLLAMTLVPIVLSLFPTPAVAAAASRRNCLGGLLDRMVGLATGRPRWVIAGFSGMILAAGFGLLDFKIETDFEQRLSETNRFRQDQQLFTHHFAGTNVIEVFIEAPLTPELITQVAAFEEDVAQLQTVDKVISVVGLLRHLDQQVGGKGQLGRLLPWLKLAKGHGIERLVDLDRGVLRLAVRLKRYGMRETHDTGRQIARIGRRHLGDQTRLEITGLMFLLGGWLDSILVGQRNGILVSLIVIALMMVIGTRSLRVGLWSMVPNVLPLLMVAGYVGAFWEQIDSDTLVIAMLAIGIGVDDTIHFLMRYRLEAARCKDRTQALRATYRFAGRAIVITSVILCLGFLPFATSDYFSIRIMGTLLPAVLIVALLADLLLVPALIQVGWMAYPANNGQPPQGPVSEESPDIPLDRAEPPR